MTLREQILEAERLEARYLRRKAQMERSKDERDKAWWELTQRMEADGVESIRVAGTNYTPASTEYFKVNDKQTFVDWAQENAPELLEAVPRKKVINERVRQWLDDGQPMPPGCDFFPRPYISRRQA